MAFDLYIYMCYTMVIQEERLLGWPLYNTCKCINIPLETLLSTYTFTCVIQGSSKMTLV